MIRLLAVGIVAAAALTVPATAADATPPVWSSAQTQSISGSNFVLNSINSPQRLDVWTVGYRYTYVGGATEFRTVAEHSVGGGSFTLVPTPDRETAPAEDMLNDVSGSSSTNVWAVGMSFGRPGPDATMIMRWNGSTWTLQDSPNPGQYGNVLEGVAALAANNVWAVGAKQDTFYQTPLALHWTGRAWKRVAMPNPSYCDGHSYLTDITALTKSDIWATGWCESSTRNEQGYLEHWDGTSWTLATDGAVPGNTELYGISASAPNNIWVVGYQVNGSAVAMRFDGTAWSQVAINAPGNSASLAGVLARPGGKAWAVGAGSSPQPPFAGPATVRFAGGPGVPVPPPTSYGRFYAICYDKVGRLWAAGMQFPGQYDQPLVTYQDV